MLARLAVLGVFCLTLQVQAPPEPELGELLLRDLRHGVGCKRVLQYAQASIKGASRAPNTRPSGQVFGAP